MDRLLQQTMRKWVDESLRVVESNPIEIADYLHALYGQAGRLDKLRLIAWRLTNRFEYDDAVDESEGETA
jgi:hypothetical protein